MADSEQPSDAGQQKLLDWQTIWQSEMAAMATDRETLTQMAAMIQVWSKMTMAIQESMHAADSSSGSARPDAARPTAAAAASGDGHDAVEQLSQRVAELERRLAELDRHAVPAKSRRKRAAS